MPQARDTNPFMKGRTQPAKEWFRIDQAFKDTENADSEVTPIYIFGEIGDSWFGDGTSANDFVKLLSGVKTPKIALHINSGGGSAFDGIAIYQALIDWNGEVEVHVDALAASAASIIAMSGDKVLMTTASMMMIHDAGMGCYGNADYMRETADILDKLSNNGAKVYAKKAGESPEFWRKLMKQEVWYDAEEAVAAGVADEVKGETSDEDLDAAKQNFDRVPYQYAGRDAAPDPLEVRRQVLQSLGDISMTTTPNPPPTPPAPPTPPTPPKGPASSTEPPEPVEPVDPDKTDDDTEPTPDEPVQPTPDTPPTQHAPVVAAGGQVTFFVNGQATTDPTAVQNRINMLEGFRKETLTAARNSFVDQLAADKKILQPQVKGLKEYALGLDEAGYAAWKGTWDGASPLSMLEPHGGPGTSDPSSQDGGGTTADELEIARETIQQHKMGGMKDEVIMQTDSFKKLKAADPTFTL